MTTRNLQIRPLPVVGFICTCLLFAMACGGGRTRKEPARLRVVAEPQNARVYLDEEYAATAAATDKNPIWIDRGKPGKRRLSVEAPGYFPHDLIVDLKPGVTTVRIKLRPIPEI